ncbi:MAG: glycosyltransferase family 2 protein [Elusimicrobiota bacterium]
MREHKLLVWGFHFFFAAFFFYCLKFFFAGMSFLCDLFFLSGLIICFLDFLVSISDKESKNLSFEKILNPKIAVGMTAYNDEESIGEAVKDFKNRESVVCVIAVDNNSKDDTARKAEEAGAIVVKETVQGYGAACKRALREAMSQGDIICLVEGDCTFSGEDLKKFTSYLENADMVLGTRTTRELNSPDSQITFSLQWGNVFMAKLMQLRFLKVRLTDMGCTYRLIKKRALEKIIDDLKVNGNHFSCEMILAALKRNLTVIEIPVTFRKRVGESKGVGSDFFKAAKTAFEMWKLIVFS